MNIQVLFTGGTIGASVQGDYIRTDERAPYMLLSMYQKSQTKLGNADCLPTFHTKTPYTLLSENLTGNTLNQLISSLSESITNNYDGIIVTHGTDTLQYSAAALSILFETCNIPIVLVSSNYILDDPRANGLVNFSHAVDFIQQSSGKKQGGVFVSYCNKGENPHIYPASALLAHDAYDDKIKCVPDNLSQTDAEKKMICNEKLLLETSAKTVAFKEPCPVVYIKAMPGQSFPDLPSHIKAVLLETYHSGTLCTTGNALADFVHKAKEKNIPVYVTGIENRTAYESTKKFKDLNLNILPSCSPIYAYMLLWLMTSR